MITKDFKNFFVGCLNEFVRSFRRISKCLFHVSMMGKIANKIVFVKCLNEEDCKRFCFNFNLFECTFSIWAPVMSVFPTFFSWELQSHFTFYLFGKLCKGCCHRNFILGKGSKKKWNFFMTFAIKGRIPLPNRMNFWKNSKRPLTPSPHFWKIMLQFLYNGYGRICARRHRPDSIS